MGSIQQLPMYITFYGLSAAVAGIVAYFVASARHRDASFWATVSILFPPAVILTFFLTTLPHEHRQIRHLESRMRRMFDYD